MTRSWIPSPTNRWTRLLAKHALGATLAAVLVLALGPGLGRSFPPRLWNPVLGRASVALLALTLVLGPLARLEPRLARLLRVRRELGVWSALLAAAHVVLLLDEFASWELGPLWTRFDGTTFSGDAGLALANLAGLAALGYALVLLATSNDLAQRRLGPRWKRLQRTATTLLSLAVLHTAFFVYLDNYPRSGFRGLGGPYASFGWVLIALVVTVAVLRTAAFWYASPARGSREDDGTG